MQTNSYRAMFTEALNAQSALVQAFVGVASFYATLAGEEYRALTRLAGDTGPAAANPGSAQSARDHATTAGLAPWSANACRAFAGLPRIGMTLFLSRYDELRGPRHAARK